MNASTCSVIEHAKMPSAELPGLQHRTLAGHDHGLDQLSVWRQTLAPGAATPPHRQESNWAYTTAGEPWLAMFRFFDPEPRLYARSWRLRELERYVIRAPR